MLASVAANSWPGAESSFRPFCPFVLSVFSEDLPVFFPLQSRVRSQRQPLRAVASVRRNAAWRAGRSHHFGEPVTNLVSEPKSQLLTGKNHDSSTTAAASIAPAIPTVHGVVQPRLFVRRPSFSPSSALGRRSFFERNCLMTRKSSFIRSLGVAATLAAVSFCSSIARAEVVFGNLGASGANDLDTGAIAQAGSAVAGQPGQQTAAAFTTSANPVFLTLTNIGAGGSLVTCGSSQLGQNGGLNLNLADLGLSNNMDYLAARPLSAAFSGSYSVEHANDVENLSTRANGSGNSSRKAGVEQSTAARSSSPSDSSRGNLDIAVEASREPSNIGIAGLGAGGLAMMVRTRRRKAASLRG